MLVVISLNCKKFLSADAWDIMIGIGREYSKPKIYQSMS